jgi:integrase
MRGCELKSLQWRHVDLTEKLLTITRSKTDAGERVIPLNATAFGAILEHRERAKKLNGTEPNHYVFPSCEDERMGPTKPQKSWRSAWRKLTRAVECPACGRIQSLAETCSNEDCKADNRELRGPFQGLPCHF